MWTSTIRSVYASLPALLSDFVTSLQTTTCLSERPPNRLLQEFTRNNRILKWFAADDQPQNGMRDGGTHGTCMASLIGGYNLGVTKTGTNMVPVRWEDGSLYGVKRASSLFDSLLWMLHDIVSNNLGGRAVINYSGGKSPDSLLHVILRPGTLPLPSHR